jgi:hypothetical protein
VEHQNKSNKTESDRHSTSTEKDMSKSEKVKSRRAKSKKSHRSKYEETPKREGSVIGDESVDPNLVFQGKNRGFGSNRERYFLE